jgi:hypothetical protein
MGVFIGYGNKLEMGIDTTTLILNVIINLVVTILLASSACDTNFENTLCLLQSHEISRG